MWSVRTVMAFEDMRTVNIYWNVSRKVVKEWRGKVCKDGRMWGAGWREGAKRDFSTAQADSFADERREKASACFGRNDRWRVFVETTVGCLWK
jgi:hypothetical protein